MTKTIKKSFVVILMLVMSLFFALAVGTGYSSASAAEEKTDAQVFIENVETFKTTVGGDDNILSNEEIRNSMSEKDKVTLFFSMYNYVSSAGSITDEDVKEAKGVYQKIYDQYNLNGAVDLYTKLTSSVYAIYTEKGQSYKDAFVVVSARTTWNELNSNEAKAQDLAMLHNSDLVFDATTGAPDMLVKAEAKVAEWKANIDDAIAAIKDIEVVTADTDDATVAVFDDENGKYLDTYIGVLKSQNTLTAAKNAIATVEAQGDLNYLKNDEGVNHYAVYNKVLEGYNEQNAKVKTVVDLIMVAFNKYSEEEGAEVCYSIHDDIVDAREAYDALVNTVVNALQDKVKAYDDSVNYLTKLETMEAEYEDVVLKIDYVDLRIELIGDVKYTEVSKNLIDDARNEFKDLPADVVAHDIAENVETTWVANYQTLLDAEAKFAEYVAQVEASIEAINGMKEFVNGTDFYSEYNKMFAVVNKNMKDLTNQLNGNGSLKGVYNTNLDEPYTPDDAVQELKTCKDAYDYYRNLATKISAQTQTISNNITAIRNNMQLRFTDTFEDLYATICKAIDSLPKAANGEDPDDRFVGAISGYNEWLTIKEDYENLVGIAEEWLATIVNHIITVNDFEALETSEEKYAALEAAYFGENDETKKTNLATDLAAFTARNYTLEETTKNYQDWFELYGAGLAKCDEINDAMDALKGQINALVRPELEDASDEEAGNVAYKAAVYAVYRAFSYLADFDKTNIEEGDLTTKEYFAENNEDVYTAYVAALFNVVANGIEEKIALITTDSETSQNRIAEAREYYDTVVGNFWDYVIEDLSEEVEFDEEEFQKCVRNFDVLTAAEELVNGFIDDVNALLVGASYEGKDVAATDLVVLDDWKKYTVEDTFLKGLYKVDVKTANDLLIKYETLTAVQKAYVDGDKSVATTKGVLENVAKIAGQFESVKGAKLSFLDDLLKKHVSEYGTGNGTTYDYEDLKCYVAALTDSQKLLLDAEILDDFQHIETDQDVAKQLREAIQKLADEVADKHITNETVIDFYVVNTIYGRLNTSQKALVDSKEDEFFAADELDKIGAAIEDSTVIDIVTKFDELDKTIADAQKDLEDQLTTIKSSIEALNTAKAALEAKDTELNGLISANKTAIDTINTQITALQTAKTSLESKVKALEDKAAALEAKDTELAGKIENIVKAGGTLDQMKKALEDAYKAADKELEDAYKAADDAIENAYKAADEAIKASLESTKTALEAAVKAEAAAREAAVKAETEAREAAVKAETEAREEATQKLNKTVVTVSVIFGVLIAALAACVVLLFVKKKA